MILWLASMVAGTACFLADDPAPDGPPHDGPPPRNEADRTDGPRPRRERPDRPPGPPAADQPDRPPRPPEAGPPDAPPDAPPDGPRRRRDARFEIELRGPDRETMRADRIMTVRRDGKNWLVSFVELVIPAKEDDEKPPIDFRKGTTKLKLDDGREIEVRPATLRGPGPPPRAPMPPEPPAEPRRPGRASAPPVNEHPRDVTRPIPPGDLPIPPPGVRIPMPTFEDGRRPPDQAPEFAGPAMPIDPEVEKLMRGQAEFEQKSARLAMQFRNARNDDERAKLREEITDAVAAQFGLRQEAREHSLRRMRQELERLEKSIRQRADNKQTLIERRVGQLLDEDMVDF